MDMPFDPAVREFTNGFPSRFAAQNAGLRIHEASEDFFGSVRSRKPTIAPVETAHHSAIPGHLGLIAMLVGRKIRWDVKKEEIIGDPGASELLSRAYRAPWRLA
jgi:hypothetical protein